MLEGSFKTGVDPGIIRWGRGTIILSWQKNHQLKECLNFPANELTSKKKN